MLTTEARTALALQGLAGLQELLETMERGAEVPAQGLSALIALILEPLSSEPCDEPLPHPHDPERGIFHFPTCWGHV